MMLIWGGFFACPFTLLLVLIGLFLQLYILLVEVTGMREPLSSRRILALGVGVSAFLLKPLSIAVWAILHWARCLVEAAGRAIAVLLFESLSSLSLLIQLLA